MTNNTAPFASLIGQQNIKSKLQFAIETKEAKRPLPHFLFTAPYGFGKTRFIREFAKTVTNGGTTGKYVEINSANIKSVSWFVEKVYMPYLQDRDNVTVLCDEAHMIPKGVQTWLLTVLNTTVLGLGILIGSFWETITELRSNGAFITGWALLILSIATYIGTLLP